MGVYLHQILLYFYSRVGIAEDFLEVLYRRYAPVSEHKEAKCSEVWAALVAKNLKKIIVYSTVEDILTGRSVRRRDSGSVPNCQIVNVTSWKVEMSFVATARRSPCFTGTSTRFYKLKLKEIM